MRVENSGLAFRVWGAGFGFQGKGFPDMWGAAALSRRGGFGV